MKQSEKKWSSLDIHLAAYLALRGISIKLERAGGHVVFTALQSDELSRLVAAYNSNDMVPVADFIGALRMLKAKMYAARDTARTAAGKDLRGGAR